MLGRNHKKGLVAGELSDYPSYILITLMAEILKFLFMHMNWVTNDYTQENSTTDVSLAEVIFYDRALQFRILMNYSHNKKIPILPILVRS